jgi:hypothetical protein
MRGNQVIPGPHSSWYLHISSFAGVKRRRFVGTSLLQLTDREDGARAMLSNEHAPRGPRHGARQTATATHQLLPAAKADV